MKLSWGMITIGTLSNLFGLVDLLNSAGLLIFISENQEISLFAGLTRVFLTFSLGIIITISGILTFRLHPWASPFAIFWAAIVASTIVVIQIPEAWEYLTYEHPEGARILWGATIGGIIGGIAYPVVLFIFFSRRSTQQYFATKSIKGQGLKPVVSMSRILTWKRVMWIVGVFSIPWIVGHGIVRAALIVLFVIVLIGIFDVTRQRELQLSDTVPPSNE